MKWLDHLILRLKLSPNIINTINMIDLIIALSPIALAPLCAIGIIMILDAI